MKTRVLLLVLGAVSVLVVGSIAYIAYTTPPAGGDPVRAFQEMAGKLADFNYDAAITYGEKSVSEAESVPNEMRLKILLARAYIGKKTPADDAQAIALYKEVAAAPNALSVQRAVAYNDLSIVVDKHDRAYFEEHFNDPPYAALLPTSGSDEARVREAYRGVLQLSLDSLPRAYTYYALAGNYDARKIVADSGDAASLAREAQTFVAQGDALPSEDTSHLLVLLGDFYRAFAIDTAARTLGEANVEDREAAYQKVIDEAAQLQIGEEHPFYGPVLSARFFLAVLMQENKPEDTAAIAAVLAPFSRVQVRGQYLGIFSTFATQSTSVHESAGALAEISPEFAQFLERIR